MNASLIICAAIIVLFAAGSVRTARCADYVSVPSATNSGAKKLSCCRLSDATPRISVNSVLAQTATGEHLKSAIRYFDGGDYTNSYIECQSALKLSPENAQCHYMLGATLMVLLDFPGATAEFKKVVDLEPTSACAHFMLAQSLRLRGKIHDARQSYKTALKLNPNDAMAQSYLLECDRVSGIDWLIADSSKVAAMDSSLPLPHTIMGQWYLSLGRIDRSIAEYEEAIRIAPGDPYVYFRYGQSLGTLERFREAEEQLRKAIALDPRYADAYLSLAWVAGKQKKFSEAMRLGRISVALAPSDPIAHINLADIYLQSGQPEFAVSECRQARDLVPESIRYQKALAFSLRDTNRIDEAIAEMYLVCQRLPLDEDLKLALQALVQKKQKERTRPDFGPGASEQAARPTFSR